MTDEQIKIMSEIEKCEHEGFIIEAHWSFIGYKCQVIIIQNDHDQYIKVENEESKYKTFSSRWDAYKAGLTWVKEK